VLVAGALVLVLVAVTARLFIWPALPALPAHVDAIVELAGQGDRDSVALALARQGRATYLVQSTVAADALSDTCLPHVGGTTVLCFHPDPDTTRGEARSIGVLAQRYGWTSVILVTSPDQAFRARLRVERCFTGEVYVATAPLPFVQWPGQLIYQWGATVKALTVQRSC
jgi:uncharacterized SAM-binding protein YcdF (DUF218 family)